MILILNKNYKLQSRAYFQYSLTKLSLQIENMNIPIFNWAIWRIVVITFTALVLGTGPRSSIAATNKSTIIKDSIPELTYLEKTDPLLKIIINTDNNKYKLVFPTSYEGTTVFVNPEKAAWERQLRLGNFIDQLNVVGARGYKLISFIYYDYNMPVGLVRLDESQYQYNWFKTVSSLPFIKEGFEEKFSELSKQGFLIVDHTLTSKYCETIDPQNAALGENCQYNDLFLLERESATRQSREQIVLNSFPAWGAKPSAEMSAQINEKIAKSFYPVSIFSQFEILLEKSKDELQHEKSDLQVVRGDMDKKVNQLAKQGYRLVLVNHGIALMCRSGKVSTPVSYVWVNAAKKNFEKQLSEVQARGGIYRFPYPNNQGIKNTLIFEQKSINAGEQGKYKVLKFEFQSADNTVERKVSTDLTTLSKETMRRLNDLVKEGFEVRDLFVSDQVSVILERTLN